MVDTAGAVALAPVRATGHAAVSAWWGDGELEPTPELRWPQSIGVLDRMRTQESQLVSVLRAVTLPIRRTTWRLHPAESRPEVYQRLAGDLGLPIVGDDEDQAPVLLRRRRDRFSWPEHLRLALLMLPFGHMFFEQEYRLDDDRYYRLRKLGPRMPHTIAKINVAPDGGLVSIEQYKPAGDLRKEPTITIPVRHLVAYVNEREGGNWRGRSLLRPAYKNWLIKDRLLRVQAQTIDRNGMGIPVYTASEKETSLDKGLELVQGYRSGDSAGAAIDNGATLQLMGVEGDLPDADKPIRYHDEQMARAVLAHFLNLGTQTGSWALGSTFADFFTLSLQSVAEDVADTANLHVVEDWVDVNFGPDEPAPRIVFDEIGSRHDATAQALKTLRDAGLLFPDRELEEHLRQMYGLPAKPATPADTLDGHLRALVAADVLSAEEAGTVPDRLRDLPPDHARRATSDLGNAARYIAVGADPVKHGWRALVRNALALTDDDRSSR